VLEKGSGAKQEHVARETLRVLIVEDNLDAAESFRMLLTLFGHEVRVAHDGSEALRIIDGFVPDIAFMDLGLPGMDGFELAGLFRADRRTEATVMVALTGYGRDEDKIRARSAGFDHHMTKPIDVAALSSLVDVLGVSVVPLRGSETTVH
jgi:CheY-like chemotaxis protein